jgi:hypothetical protein
MHADEQAIEHFADLDARLQKRHNQLVREHLGKLDAVAAGLRALPGEGTAFASTQAAWRFYANPDVTLPVLAQPLIASALAASPVECPDYALVLHDWTDLNFKEHSEKLDRIKMCSKGTLGYLVQTSLLISSRTGTPIAPLSLSLWASDGMHTTRSARVLADEPQIDELTHAMAHVEGTLTGKPVVHIVDRGADSVDHYRQWKRAERFFLVRADAVPRVVLDGETMSLGAVAERLQLSPSREVEVSTGVYGQQFVAETVVRLERPAFPHRQRGGVKAKRKMIRGEAIELRLVVSQVRAPDETVVGHWLLLTNVGSDIEAEQIALWYYWRWKIESYFKLLKGAGHQVEHWRQETAEAIAKRMLVAAMACVVVWQLARSQAAEAKTARALLVRLSGRQMQRGKAFTEPALLAGLWVFLAMMDALEQYSLEELKQMARLIVPEFPRPSRN